MMRTTYVTVVSWLFATSATLMAGTILSVDPATITVTPGQTFALHLDISGATDLYGYQFDLGFNSAVLQALSVTEGSFLVTGGPTIFLPGTIDNVGGTITANADILNGAVPGVNGSGDLLDVTFQALATGLSDVQIFNLIALDSVGLGLTVGTADSAVTVSTTPEPGTGLLVGASAIGIFAFLRGSRSASTRLSRRTRMDR